MYEIIYHFKNPALRKRIDLTKFTADFVKTASKFSKIELVDVMPDDYAIRVHTNDEYEKNRLVRKFGRAFAKSSYLGAYVEHNEGSSTLFKAKDCYII